MPNYKDKNNNLHFIEREFAHLLPSGSLEISDAEAAQIREQNKPKPDPKAEAQAYLNSTDWYVVRFAETGVPVPAEVTTKRAAARALLP